MQTIQELERQRAQVLQQMQAIDSMKRGTITEQYVPILRGGKPTGHRRGPYYVFSRREGNRTVSQRLRSSQELRQAQQDVAAHQRFVALCKQFEELTERLSELRRGQLDHEREKKQRRSRSNKIGK